ncbi:MAG: outer membrane beta-barrel protein [candidate division Zixibacteria bacterium]|nr:outer membrane beta-barrel protein [candidate division Zixibacteria bacterium]
MSRFLSRLAIVVSVIACCASAASGAGSAIDKGSVIVGGGAAYCSLSGDLYEDGGGDGVTILLFAPECGAFVTSHLALSGQLIIGQLKRGDDKLYTVGVGPRLRYYFGETSRSEKVKGTTYPYLAGGFTWGQYNDEDSDKHTVTAISLGGGITHMVANSVGLYAEINYRADRFKKANVDSESGSSINFMAGFTLFLWE